MDKLSQISFFNQTAQEWDTLFPTNHAKLRCITELCDIKPGADILDAACGTGRFLPFLLDTNPNSILAVDFSGKMLEQAQNRCRDNRVAFQCCDIMEITDQAFDYAILLNAFVYFENRGSLIRQLHHLLSPQGRLMICHDMGRSEINSKHQANSNQLAMPLPAANILSRSIEPYFDIDMVIDSDGLYAISGIKKAIDKKIL